jgi:S-adenosylmethionine hydrolase
MVCPVKVGISTLPMNCDATPTYSAGWNGYIGVTSTTSSEFQVQTIDNNNNNNLPFNISCKKQGVDYKPKTAKVASSIGVPTVPGLTTEAVDTFSVSYGTTNATTVCSASPCSYLDQIGNAVSSITRTGTGQYSLNTVKTYSKLKCTGGASDVNAMGKIACSNCSSVSFLTIATPTTALVDTYGTILCQGTY